ncbi:MAG: TadE/TadG family type IV pilus assembly protein, partial [Beijerinckiaceae bacterium]
MAQLFARCRRALRGFRDDRAGNTGMIFAFAAPMLIGGAMMSIEMSQVAKGQSKLQGIADSAAIAAARELRLGNTTKDTVLSVAQSVVEARASSIGTPVVFAGDVPSDKKWVSVELSAETTPSLAGVFGLTPTKVSAQAKAIVMGGAPVCGVTLKDKKNMALNLDKNARLEARNCAVYVNSDGPNALKSKDSATMTSAMTCIVGGKDGLPGSFTPEPTTGCPVFPDPLASRPPPSFGACDPAKTKLVISGEVTSITPGVYCGGLTITKNSDVTAMAGIYIIADGELRVDG